jgi:hypothetical protein
MISAGEAKAWRTSRRCETLDDYYIAAVEAVSVAGFGSTRLLQSRLGIAWYLSLVLIEEMQKTGMLGEFDNAALQYHLIEPRGFH